MKRGWNDLWLEIPEDAQPAVARLLARIAHDLKTPMSTLGLEAFTLSALAAKADTPAADRRMLDAVRDNLDAAQAELVEMVGELAGLAEAPTSEG